MLYKSIRYLVKRGRRPAALAAALASACVGVAFAQAGVPDRIADLTATASTATTASLSWRIDPDAKEYEVGIWVAGLIRELPNGTALATVSTSEPFEAVEIHAEGSATSQLFLGFHTSESVDPAHNASLTYGDYYYNTTLSKWRQEFCSHATQGCGGNYANFREWVDMPNDGPTGWQGAYSSESDALHNVTAVDQLVIFPNAIGLLNLYELVTLTATASVTGIPEGRHYLSVRGTNRLGEGDWAYLVSVGSAAADTEPEQGKPVALSGIIYTDEVPNIEHYMLDETTLILAWQNVPGARHYDVRLNGEVTRITAHAGSGQQVAVSLASRPGQNLSYQARGVIETGSLDVRVKDADDELIYIVPPNSVVYSRWSADRSINVQRLGMIKGPGTESLMTDPEPPSDIITDLIGDVLKVSTLMDEDADAGDVQVWTLPLGLLGSIFLGGLTGYGAGRGRLDKAAIIAGGLVFFVCWGYLCPVYLKIPWPVIFSVIVLVVGPAIAIVLNDYLR